MFPKILIPVNLDRIEQSKSCFKRSVEYASHHKADVRLIFVCSTIPLANFGVYGVIEIARQDKKIYEDAIGALANSLEYPRDKISTTVREGIVYVEIIEEVDFYKPDLIIFSSKYPTISDLFFGSLTSKICTRTKCAKLFVR